MAQKYYAGIGSRSTPDGILAKMTKIAAKLEEKGFTLRSGGAAGADTAFANGASDLEVYVPWQQFNGIANGLCPTEKAFEIARKYHPVWDSLSVGVQKLHARNVHQILGYDCNTPSEFVVCWTPDGAETETSRATGGTGQALRIAIDHGISVFNLKNENAISNLKQVILQILADEA